MAKSINEDGLLGLLEEALLIAPAEQLHGVEVHTFAVVGLRSRKKGLVLRLASGDEFHLTVVQSRRARNQPAAE